MPYFENHIAVAFTCVAVLAALTVSAPACSSTDRSYTTDEAGSILPNADGGPLDASTDCGSRRCSRDLKKVLETCNGEDSVIAECGPDQGCGDGACVDACQAAALSKGSMGCDFYTLPPEDYGYGGGCFAAFIANTWDRPVTLAGELDGQPIDVAASAYLVSNDGPKATHTHLEGPLPVGAVAVVFLAQSGRSDTVSCPAGVKVALTGEAAASGTALTRAFRLRADAPVSAYSISPYGGSSSYVPSATLLYPTTAWDTNYIAVSPGRVDTQEHSQSEFFKGPVVGPRTLQIVASEDGTEVRMRPTADIASGIGLKGVAKGFVQTWTLNRGQVLQFVQDQSLTGSPIEASKPIGVFGGSECSFIPSYWLACDIMQQQVAPLKEWGSSYALVPYRPRVLDTAHVPTERERTPWMVVAGAAGTTLRWDPAAPVGAPTTMEAGQAMSFFTDAPVTVTSQDADHPLFVGSYMTGAQFDRPNETFWPLGGDPDFVSVVPSDQFLDRYVFFADHTYAETTLTIVRRKTANGFAPVNLDCGDPITDFRPVGTSGEYEFTWVHLTSGFAPGTGNCGYGRHEATSGGPFSLTVWGTDFYASYGYAGGTGLRPLTTVEQPVH